MLKFMRVDNTLPTMIAVVLAIIFGICALCYLWYLYVKTGSKRRLFALLMFILTIVILFLTKVALDCMLIAFFGAAAISVSDDKMHYKDELERMKKLEEEEKNPS